MLSLFFVLVVSALGVLGLYTGSAWMLLISAVVLFSLGIFPKKSICVTWPMGLITVIGLNYVGYMIAWYQEKQMISRYWSRDSLLVILGVGTCLALLRFAKISGGSDCNKSFTNASSTLIISLFGLVIILWSLRDLLFDPISMVAGHLTGGDHSMHVGLSINMTNLTGSPYLKSPFDVYGYPMAIQSLITNLVQSDFLTSDRHALFQFHLMAAWFERVQLAAYIQLFVCVALRGMPRKITISSFYAVISVLTFLIIEGTVAQLIWSGFTTSLASSWILLGIPAGLYLITSDSSIRSKFVWNLALVAGIIYVISIVYQPLALVPLAAFVALVTCSIFNPKSKRFMTIRDSTFPTVVGSAFVVTAIYLVYRTEGRDNVGFQTLKLAGATYNTSHFLVIFITISTLFLTLLKVVRIDSNRIANHRIDLSLLAGYATFIVSLVVVLQKMRVGPESLTPYYIQKLIWGLLFLALPILLNSVFLLVESVPPIRIQAFRELLFLASFILTMQHKVQIENQFRHERINWVAEGISRIENNQLPLRAVVYFSGDHLGSHVGNLAIAWVNPVVMPFELRITDRIDLVCKFIIGQDVTTVITADGGLDELIANGCPEVGVEYSESHL